MVLLGPFFWRFLKQIKHKENKWVQSLWAEKVEDSTTRLSLENSEWERLWGGGWTLASGDDFAPLFEGKEKERETLKANVSKLAERLLLQGFSHTLSLGGFIYWYFFSMQVLSFNHSLVLKKKKKKFNHSPDFGLGLKASKKVRGLAWLSWQ